MKCPYPLLIKNKYGYIREIPCGQCTACRLNHSAEFALRIMNEASLYSDNCFLTLTYDDEHLPEHGTLVKRDLQLFQKRLRRVLNKKIRFYSVGEYGDLSFRCHYHLIVFGLSPVDDVFKDKKYDKKHDGWHARMDIWENGFVFTAPVTYDDAQYVAKYCMKKLTGEKGRQFYEDRGLIPPFVMMSNRPGIGFEYLKRNWNRIDRHGYVIGKNGKKCPIPRYYREKMYLPLYRCTMGNIAIREKLEELKENACKQGKSLYDYKQDLLENAKNIVNSFIERKKKDEL